MTASDALPAPPGPAALRLAVRGEPGGHPMERARRIIVGLDFTDATDAALDSVIAAAASQAVFVEIVYVADVFTASLVRRARTPKGTAGMKLHAALSRRVELARSRGVRCRGTILVGLPGLALSRHADRIDANVLVLGLEGRRRGRSGPTWVTLAAERILRDTRWRPWPTDHRPTTSSARTLRARWAASATWRPLAARRSDAFAEARGD